MSAEPNLNETDYELLSAYIDEMLTDEERTALEVRLKTDASLRRELNALRQTVALVQGLPPLKAPRNFTLTPEMVGLTSDEATTPTASMPATSRRIIPFPAISVLSAVASVALVIFGLSILLTGSASDEEMSLAGDESTVGVTTNSIPDDSLSIAAAPSPSPVPQTADDDMAAGGAAMPQSPADEDDSDDVIAGDMAEEAAPMMEMEDMAESEPQADMAFDEPEPIVPPAPSPDPAAMSAPFDGEPAMLTDVPPGVQQAAPTVIFMTPERMIDGTTMPPDSRMFNAPAGTPTLNELIVPPTALQQAETEVAQAQEEITEEELEADLDIEQQRVVDPIDEGDDDNTLIGLLVIVLGAMLAIVAGVFAWRDRKAA